MRLNVLIAILILLPGAAFAQATPAAAAAPRQAAPAPAPRPAPASVAAPVGTAKVAIIDFQRALERYLSQTEEGKKFQEEATAARDKWQGEIEKKTKPLEELTTRRTSQDKALSETAKADLDKQINQLQQEAQAVAAKAEQEMGALQQELLGPIYNAVGQRVREIVAAYATEQRYTVVMDAGSVVFFDEVADVTTEVLRRVDADVAATQKQAPAPAAPAK
jgi:outer membrane protein